MYNLQAQNITIIDSTDHSHQITTIVITNDDCSTWFEQGISSNHETMYIKGYSDTKEHFYILIDCNGYIIEVDGIRHKTEQSDLHGIEMKGFMMRPKLDTTRH